MKRICLLGAYVKRRVNLALICEKNAAVPVDELTHCIRESLACLTQHAARACALHQTGKGNVSSRDIQTAYDFFEDCLEAALPSLSALMVRVECGERFSIRLMMEDAAGLPGYGALCAGRASGGRRIGRLPVRNARLPTGRRPPMTTLHAGLLCTCLLLDASACLFSCVQRLRNAKCAARWRCVRS